MTHRHSVFISQTEERSFDATDGEPIGEKTIANICGQMAHALRLSQEFERDGRRFHNELKEAGSDD